MIVAAADASEFFCPMVMSARTAPDVNRQCVGSKCMAWREVEGERGYCGMAGTPGIPALMQSLIDAQAKAVEKIGQPQLVHHSFSEQGPARD